MKFLEKLQTLLNWILGLTILIASLGFFISGGVVSGIAIVAISLLIIPLSRKLVYSWTKRELSGKSRLGIIFILMLVSGYFVKEMQENKLQEEALAQQEKIRQERIDFFKGNRDRIVESIQDLVSSGDYKAAIAATNEYDSLKDDKLAQLKSEAKLGLENEKKENANRHETERKTEIERLLSANKDVDEKNLDQKILIYTKLVELDNSNGEFKEKLNAYTKELSKISEARQKDENTKHVDVVEYSNSADEAAKKELKDTQWIRDLYVSPGYMNVGVLKTEKDWASPMIGKWVCGVLAKHGSTLTFVRFVDIEGVVYHGKSPRQAEIAKFKCKI